MAVTKAIRLRLKPGDYERLESEARRLGTTPPALASEYVHASLHQEHDTERAQRVQSGSEALRKLASLRARLPDVEPIDVVQLIRQGRDELDGRLAL